MQATEKHNRDEEIKRLMEENQRLLKLVVQISEKTRKYVLWGRIMSAIYLIIIIAPIILAVIFLPPFVQSVVGPYQDLLSGSMNARSGTANGVLDGVQQFLDEYQATREQ